MFKNLKEQINFLIDIGKSDTYIYDQKFLGSSRCLVNEVIFDYREKARNFILTTMNAEQKDFIENIVTNLNDNGDLLGIDSEVLTRFSVGGSKDYICLKNEGYGIEFKLYKKIKRIVSDRVLQVKFYREGKSIIIGFILDNTLVFILAPALCPLEAKLFDDNNL